MKTLNVNRFPSGLLADGIRKCARQHIVIRDNRKAWRLKWETYHKDIIDKINYEEDYSPTEVEDLKRTLEEATDSFYKMRALAMYQSAYRVTCKQFKEALDNIKHLKL